jgi:hypothetical protein
MGKQNVSMPAPSISVATAAKKKLDELAQSGFFRKLAPRPGVKLSV